MVPVSVVLIRELPRQMTGSGCCGKLEGDNLAGSASGLFDSVRQQQITFGVYHRAIRAFFPEHDVSIVTVDPRNQLYLTSKLWHDAFVYRPGLKPALQVMLQLFPLPAVVVNARLLTTRDAPLHPDDLCHHVRSLLEGSPSVAAETQNE